MCVIWHAELGPQNIRVNAISAGPIRTLASSAVGGILDMIHHVEEVAPLRRTVTQLEVGNAAAFLCSDLPVELPDKSCM